MPPFMNDSTTMMDIEEGEMLLTILEFSAAFIQRLFICKVNSFRW